MPTKLVLTRSRFVNNVKFVGGVVKLVPLQPPKATSGVATSSQDWTVDMDALEAARTPKTKMLVCG